MLAAAPAHPPLPVINISTTTTFLTNLPSLPPTGQILSTFMLGSLRTIIWKSKATEGHLQSWPGKTNQPAICFVTNEMKAATGVP